MTGANSRQTKHAILFYSFVASGILISSADDAYAMTIGAYAVGNHSSCGASNIPGTIIELDKFFDSENYPEQFEKNFYWKDARVRQSEWIKAGDYVTSTETNSGFDGADSSLLTYIASHGVTSSGVYKALAGSKNSGGCYIPTTSLELGNNMSRYTILSTCQGLKIGSGDYPNSSGENPSRTWKNSAKGLNCIFGYSNNMADDDGYGEYLLANIKDGETPLSKAFMDASESVYSDNIPAVLCYGANEQDATDYIENNNQFESQARPNQASAWVYRMTSHTASTRSIPREIPSMIRLKPKAFDVEKISRVFLGQGALKQRSNKNNYTFSSSAGRATYNSASGTLTIRNRLIDAVKQDAVPDLIESEKIARHVLRISGLQTLAGDLVLTQTSEDVAGGIKGIKRALNRKFTYKQILAGSTALSQQGSIDVTVGPAGVVTDVKAALLEVDSSVKALMRPTDLASRLESIEIQAIKSAASKSPGANYRVIKQRLGYDAGNFHRLNSQAPAVIEVTVEAGLGEYRRNFIEKIIL